MIFVVVGGVSHLQKGIFEIGTSMKVACPSAVPPDSALQQMGTHKVLGRGWPSAERTRALRARVLIGRWPAAELGS
jgi:hypothetical protein